MITNQQSYFQSQGSYVTFGTVRGHQKDGEQEKPWTPTLFFIESYFMFFPGIVSKLKEIFARNHATSWAYNIQYVTKS